MRPFLGAFKKAAAPRPRAGAGAPPPPAGPGPGEAAAADLFPRVTAADFPEKPPLVNGLPPRLMRRWQVVPLEVSEAEVRVAMARPGDLYLREILAAVYGRRVRPLRAEPDDVLAAVYRWYEAEVDLEGGGAEDEAATDDALWDDPEQLRDLATEAPVIRLVNHFIGQALEAAASDIHFEPYRDHMKVRFRIDGVLNDVETVAKKLQPAITSRLKLMAKMNIAEMRLPQDGRIKVREGRREVDIRVSTLPTLFGESIVLRLLNREEVRLDLETLGLPGDVRASFERAILRPHGLVLVTGPTGSGKTTTLYAVIHRINQPEKKIVTVEDPVEYQLDGVNQIQVRPRIGLTFASALRTILRQDPDVILVGEIRDAETAEIAVQSALTGHLVFSTLHTNDAASAVTRLQEMGVEPYLLSSSLLGVLAQRLVRRVCPRCGAREPLAPELRAEMAEAVGAAGAEIPGEVVRGRGCPECAQTGYRGRMGIFEWLEVGDGVRRLILQEADSGRIAEAARAEGMRSLRQDGLRKVLAGETTPEEVMRVTQ
ncbi:Flp pilus assembly complex ATPase component [Dissulfurirhabdus thermomarina]|uniref:Flp pilus assembly complex ATPase component n=1 Tax=Dissulfurirhabdus thermomarina TaxID=1765737 RepID=A0A6N9TLD7_DISTH|nr:ATPase, T2SS/T4P/T4SS family [Dissulfurirhabdus thermomarina]NDY42091.1 Flp pilus assembly complex ATPase component [Dissulfurirhabdus thermomarina]NMX22497.1 Flp pilus assembly complex ATPase component TadA [Dissulfurirhabdus thermomarina]